MAGRCPDHAGLPGSPPHLSRATPSRPPAQERLISLASPNHPVAGAFPLDVLARQALEELGGVMDALPGDPAGEFVREVRAARRVALYGVGREGLVMWALVMRPTTPACGPSWWATWPPSRSGRATC